jgi:hypothetical protein
MGDSQWENPMSVNDGVVQDIIPGETESLWLKGRWLAATATAPSQMKRIWRKMKHESAGILS